MHQKFAYYLDGTITELVEISPGFWSDGLEVVAVFVMTVRAS